MSHLCAGYLRLSPSLLSSTSLICPSLPWISSEQRTGPHSFFTSYDSDWTLGSQSEFVGTELTPRLCSPGAQSESAQSKMLSGIGGFVLGLIFLGLGLFVRHRSQKGEESGTLGWGAVLRSH